MNDNDLKNFKQILQRFVAYLEFANALSTSEIISKNAKVEDKFKNFYNDKDANTKITELYDKLCRSCGRKGIINISEEFGWSGQGYRDKGSILNLIKDICVFEDGQISISIDATSAYTSKGCYLHWLVLGEDVSIYPIWESNRDEQNNKIKSLMVCLSKDKNKDSTGNNSIPINNITNDNFVIPFYDLFVSLKKESLSLLLFRAKNIIFTGAPGTGKTYLAKQIANLIGAKREFVQFHPSYDYTDFVEGLRPKKDNSGNIAFERKDGIFKAFCEMALKQWLLDLLQEDAQQGQVATKDNKVYKKIWLKLKGFTTKEAVEKEEDNASMTQEEEKQITAIQNLLENLTKEDEEANKDAKKETVFQDKITPFVFIIDEINRGEISKIFGELFFSVDPGYRGIEGMVKTQYSNLQIGPNLFDLVLLALKEIESGEWGHFFIPENVYIIGTMNDIDRSVESMDFAFRRRFTFKEIEAKDTQLQILKDVCTDKDKRGTLVETMDKLNDAISAYEEFSNAYHIGGAYFRHYKDYVGQEKPMDKLWDNHIKGVLKEYLRGRPDCDSRLDDLKANYDKGLFGKISITEQQLKGYLAGNVNYKEKSDEIIEEIRGILRENIDEAPDKILKSKVSSMDGNITIDGIIKEIREQAKQEKAQKRKKKNQKQAEETEVKEINA